MGCDTHRPVHESREGTTATLCGDTRLQKCISRCALRCAAAAPIVHIVFDFPIWFSWTIGASNSVSGV
jgi:hypothetical protein